VPECGVHVKRANRAREYRHPSKGQIPKLTIASFCLNEARVDYQKNENVSKNRNASVVSAQEKNASKSVCGVSSGMRRLNTSENDAWHASKNG